MQKCHPAAGHRGVSLMVTQWALEWRTVVFMTAFLMIPLHSLARSLTFLDCPAASKISAKKLNSTLSMAFAGVRNAIHDEMWLVQRLSYIYLIKQRSLTICAQVVRRPMVGPNHACMGQIKPITILQVEWMSQDIPVNAFGSPLPSLFTAGEGEPGPPVQL